MIDAHVHVFTRASAAFPREVTNDLPAEGEATAEQLLETMAESGVERANLIQIGGREHAHHAYLLHCLKAYPDRFRGIGLVADPRRPVDSMDRLAGEGGVIGFRLFDLGAPADPRETDIRLLDTYPVWQHAAEKDYVIWLYPKGTEHRWVPSLMAAFPELTVVYNHLAFCPSPETFARDAEGRPRIDLPIPPPTADETLGLARYPNVCVLLSGQYAFSKGAYPYPDLRGWHRTLLDTFGAGRLMWATDSPWILENPGYGALARVIDAQLPDLDAGVRAQVMGGTAGVRLFGR